jgi:retron-type reverse transcriptase
LINSAQNGFRANKSTYTAIQYFIEEILNALDSKHLAVGLLQDLLKAFDVINHDRLLAKLELYGLRGKIHEWMTSYLTNRFQYVEIYYQDHLSSCSKSFTSNLNEIKPGVPQGSVLGPLLFMLFINDLPNALPLAKVVLFADDTNILLIDNSIEALNGKIKKVIDLLESWFNDNKLLINTEKAKVLFFHEKGLVSKYRPAICVCNREVLYSSKAKFLGIEMLENLSWKNHIQYLCPC